MVVEARKPDIPLTTFRGWLKCHRASNRTKLADIVFTHSFPAFDGPGKPTERSVYDEIKFEEVQKANLERKERGEEEFKILDLPRDAPPARRFAGDHGSLRTMDRGRYYSVCANAQGFDFGTLENELNSYCIPSRGGIAMAFELGNPNNPSGIHRPGWLGLFMTDASGVASPGLTKARNEGLVPADETRAVATTQCDISHVEIDRILDLRLPLAQDWLVNKFGAGDGDWLTYPGRPPPAERGFFYILPTLMDRDFGGNALTHLIGAYLRTHDVNALIYPSARSNVFCALEDGEITVSGGWCLVDYRNTAKEFLERRLVWASDWKDTHDSFLGRIGYSFAEPGSRHAGSFQISNNEEYQRLLRHLLLCFEVWKKFGDQTPVRGYQWHTTTSRSHSGQMVVDITCIECGNSVAIQVLTDIPYACPRCGSKAVHLP